MTNYHVTFEEWTVWCIDIDATSEDDAIEKARELWIEEGSDAGFDVKKGSDDNWEATS